MAEEKVDKEEEEGVIWQFFKPTAAKIIITLLCFIFFESEFIYAAACREWWCGFKLFIRYLPATISGNLPEAIFIPILISIIYYYFIACFLVWIYWYFRYNR